MFIRTALIIAFVSILTIPLSIAKETVGWVEKVRIYPGGITLKAKIDTGAKTTSLHCDCATPFNRKGKKWIAFTVTNHKGQQIKLQRKIERVGKVKRHFGERQVRYIIKLGVCLGSVYKETEVNLIDRSGMNYPLLIGRRFLQESHVIDPALTFTTQPDCKPDAIH